MKLSSLNVTHDTQTTKNTLSTVDYSDTQSMFTPEMSVNINEMTDENGNPTKQAYQTAVNKMNEFMEYSHKDSKFVFHDGLEKYYVEIVDSKTDEVIKEIPPKELLDAYYEMQKQIGKMFDTKA